jgi:hypothetical protein
MVEGLYTGGPSNHVIDVAASFMVYTKLGAMNMQRGVGEMRRAIAIIALVAAVLACCGPVAFAAGGGNYRAWVVAPARCRVVPEAGAWRIAISVFAVRAMADASIEEVSCMGHDLGSAMETGQFTRIPITVAWGVSPQDLDRWRSLRRAWELDTLAPTDADEFGRLNELISRNLPKDSRPLELTLQTANLPFEVKDHQDYPVTVRLRHGDQVEEFTSIMAVRTLPSDSNWSPGDFHIHSTWSDGTMTPSTIASTLQDMGYKIAYVTDHTDLIGNWTNYASAIGAASTSYIKLYPGAEMTVRDFQSLERMGDLLAYGVSSLTGLDNKLYLPQVGIDNILNSNPSGPSSPAIAHPSGVPAWPEPTYYRWDVAKYRGWELMSGTQVSFSDSASPMVRWRNELTRLLSDTFTYGYFASARTGSDIHGTSHPGYVTYIRTSSWTSKSSVDTTLYNGKTVASRKGGLAYMSLKFGATTKQVGERLTGVPANGVLYLNITFKPVESGSYTIKVYRDNKVQTVFSTAGSYAAGSTYYPASNYTFTFPGGSHYYYLYVYSTDYIYSSPIFVAS